MKNILLIDGEYYEKQIKPQSYTIEEIIPEYFGKLFYPDKIIYFSARVCDDKKEELSTIKNLVINEKGYVVKKRVGNTWQQKGVDGYIIAELVKLGFSDVEMVTLLSGDGDMKAGVESFYEMKQRKVNVIGLEGSISSELEDFCELYNLPKLKEITKGKEVKPQETEETKTQEIEEVEEVDIDEDIEAMDEIVFTEPKIYNSKYNKYIKENNIQSLKSLASFILIERHSRLTMSFVGQNAKKFGFKYKGVKLLDLFLEMENRGIVKLEKREDEIPDYYIDIL